MVPGHASAILKAVLFVAIAFAPATMAAAPVNTLGAVRSWNLGNETIYNSASGLRGSNVFANVVNTGTVYTLDPPNQDWVSLRVDNSTGTEYFLLTRNYFEDTYGTQFKTVSVIATNPDGNANITFNGYLAAPTKTARYPTTSRTAPLATQSTRTSETWFTDKFPPDNFDFYGEYKGRDNVLALRVGPGGKPSVRAAAFSDPSLTATNYDIQGRRYAVNRTLTTNWDGTSFTASLYVPGEWIDNAPGTPGCELESDGCQRATFFEVEFGENRDVSDGGFRPVLTSRFGFDNRVAGGVNNFVNMTLDATALAGTTYPYSAKGTLLDNFALGSKFVGWEGILQRNAWNNFTLEVLLMNTDRSSFYAGSRTCSQTMRFIWVLNGKRFTHDTSIFATRYVCMSDTAGESVPTKINFARDVIVSAYNPRDEQRAVPLQPAYTAFWSGINLYKGSDDYFATLPAAPTAPPPIVRSPPPVYSPPPTPVPPAPICIEDSLNLELVDATGTNAASHPYAKCFSSFSLGSDDQCTLTLTAKSGNNYVDSFWSASPTYGQVIACPTASTKSFSAAITTGNIASLFAESIWPQTPTTTPTITVSSGVLTVVVDGVTLKYRSAARFQTATNGIFSTVGAPSCSTATECAATTTGCTAGRHAVEISGYTTTYICALCGSGSYSAAGDASCTKCAAGSALDVVGGTSIQQCTTCSAGKFASAGSSDCRTCSPNYFQSASGSSSCKACPTGWSSHVYGATKCVKCIAGRPATCTDATGATCDATAGSSGEFTAVVPTDTLKTKSTWNSGFKYPELAGTCSGTNTLLSFSVSAICSVQIQALGVSTSSSGLACSNPSNSAAILTAYYTDATTMMSRLPSTTTAGGYIAKAVKGTAATALDFSIIAATIDPTKKPQNTVIVTDTLTVNGGQLLTATAAAATCPAGSYRTGTTTADISCKACPVGQFCTADVTSATDCVAGTANSLLGAGDCPVCSGSTYAHDPGMTTCKVCENGGIVSNDKTTCSTDEVNCPDGKTFDVVSLKCLCSPGYGTTNNATTCTKCASGYSSAGGVADCAACSTNTYSPAGSVTCSACPVGTASNADGVCVRCARGQEPAPNGSACQSCASGFFNPPNTNLGESVYAMYPTCQRVPAGKRSNVARTLTFNCDAGTYSTWTDSATRVPADGSTCQVCSSGTISAAGSKRCTACPAGTLSDGTVCTRCPTGTYRPSFGANVCENCPIGSDTFGRTGAAKCRSCSPGEFGAAEGTAMCSSCPVNTVSVDYNAASCVECPSGTDTDGDTGLSECSDCSPGYFNPASGGNCQECAAGEWQDTAGQLKCKKCTIGTFSGDTGSTECELCEPGTYQGRIGQVSCRTCPPGTWSDAGKGSCILCNKGYYSGSGSRSCTQCAPGFYAGMRGLAECAVCPAGSFCAGNGVVTPVKCPPGTWQNKTGKTACSLCPRRTYSSVAGATACLPCSSASAMGTTSCPSRRRALLNQDV